MSLEKFLRDFYTEDERLILYGSENKEEDINSDFITKYNKVLNFSYRNLLKPKLSDAFRLEVDKSCTSLINKIFDKFISKDTYVLTTEDEHPSIKYNLYKSTSFIILRSETNKEDAIDKILTSFKLSRCKNFVCFMSGTSSPCGGVIDQSFFIKLKVALLKHKIPHLLIIDACQELFISDRDYNLFDMILGTAHVLVFESHHMGLLFIKGTEQVGYINDKFTKEFLPKLEIVVRKKQNLFKFQEELKRYFPEILDLPNVRIHDGAKNFSAIKIKNGRFQEKHKLFLGDSVINLSEINSPEANIKIRAQEAIKDPDKYLKSLDRLAILIKKVSRMSQLGYDVNFDNSILINYEYETNGVNQGIIDQKSKHTSDIYNNKIKDSLVKEVSNIKFIYAFIRQNQR